jgi:hypothetical protein
LFTKVTQTIAENWLSLLIKSNINKNEFQYKIYTNFKLWTLDICENGLTIF